jgi:hypothetical protein
MVRQPEVGPSRKGSCTLACSAAASNGGRIARDLGSCAHHFLFLFFGPTFLCLYLLYLLDVRVPFNPSFPLFHFIPSIFLSVILFLYDIITDQSTQIRPYNQPLDTRTRPPTLCRDGQDFTRPSSDHCIHIRGHSRFPSMTKPPARL